jgi:hypothetical protein
VHTGQKNQYYQYGGTCLWLLVQRFAAEEVVLEEAVGVSVVSVEWIV